MTGPLRFGIKTAQMGGFYEQIREATCPTPYSAEGARRLWREVVLPLRDGSRPPWPP